MVENLKSGLKVVHTKKKRNVYEDDTKDDANKDKGGGGGLAFKEFS